jgi:multiple sugar transport system permease protein
MLYPLIDSVILSFSNYRIGVSEQTFVGLDNYRSIFSDPVFMRVLGNTFIYVILVVPATVILTLLFAELIIDRRSGEQTFFRIAFYLPVVLSTVTVALVWNNLYSTAFGILNFLVKTLGGTPVNWLGDAKLVKFSLSLVIITFTMGQPLIMNLAAMGSIPVTYSEAAYIDGASRWQRFWLITFPLLRPTTLYVAITTTIKSFQVFAIVKLMSGGGPNYASDTVVSLIYKVAFSSNNLSRASTMGVVLAVIIGIFAIMQFRLLASDETGY